MTNQAAHAQAKELVGEIERLLATLKERLDQIAPATEALALIARKGDSGTIRRSPRTSNFRNAVIFTSLKSGDGKRFIVRADETLTAFVELESAIWRSRCLPDRTMHVRPYLTFSS